MLLLPVEGRSTTSLSGATVVVGGDVVSARTVVVVGATVVVVDGVTVVVGASVVVGATVVVVVVAGTCCHIAYKWSVSPLPGITYASEGE